MLQTNQQKVTNQFNENKRVDGHKQTNKNTREIEKEKEDSL